MEVSFFVPLWVTQKQEKEISSSKTVQRTLAFIFKPKKENRTMGKIGGHKTTYLSNREKWREKMGWD